MTNLALVELILSLASLPISITVLICVNRHLKLFKPPKIDTNYIDVEHAPSVTVCIPVRNEDQAIRDCLERVLSSNYPKLEVIVLDDESVDTTPEIVRIFAHDGVRFVPGQPLPEGWIGKNKAADILTEQASGKYILFLSADTDIKPDSISKLMAYALRHHLQMVCIMPTRKDGWRFSAIMAPLRYFWTILYHSKAYPAHTTASWLVDRDALLAQGGFDKYKSLIKPEPQIAHDFFVKGRYRFLISDAQFGFSYEKKWSSQVETSIRIDYPFVRQNWFTPVLFIVFELLIWSVIIYSLATNQFSYYSLGLLISALIINLAYTQFSIKARPRTGILGFFTWPIKIAIELVLIIFSLFKLKFNSVVWKGRRLTDHID